MLSLSAHLCCVCGQYYELLDTFLRVLKGQPLTFLHVFHHAVVLTMAYGVRGGAPHCGKTALWSRARGTRTRTSD